MLKLSLNKKSEGNSYNTMRAVKSGFLGLERVIRRLIAEDGFRNKKEALEAIRLYESFFIIVAQNPEKSFTPSYEVDLVWQRHMLDTLAYKQDCEKWAGTYIHRFKKTCQKALNKNDFLGESNVISSNRPVTSYAYIHQNISICWDVKKTSVEDEDLSGLIYSVQSALENNPAPLPWMIDALVLLKSNPEIALEEYKHFIKLMVHGKGSLTPCKLVDEFWHQHILESENYFNFCARVAGRYLNHIPHYEKTHKFHMPSFKRTMQIYEDRLGVAPPQEIWKHMGESGGCETSPSHAIDETSFLACVKLRIGNRSWVSRPNIIENNGLPIWIWKQFLDDVASMDHSKWPAWGYDKSCKQDRIKQLINYYGSTFKKFNVALQASRNENFDLVIEASPAPLLLVEAPNILYTKSSLTEMETKIKFPDKNYYFPKKTFLYDSSQISYFAGSFLKLEHYFYHIQDFHYVLKMNGMPRNLWQNFMYDIYCLRIAASRDSLFDFVFWNFPFGPKNINGKRMKIKDKWKSKIISKYVKKFAKFNTRIKSIDDVILIYSSLEEK